LHGQKIRKGNLVGLRDLRGFNGMAQN
jgi:hypothetical protein